MGMAVCGEGDKNKTGIGDGDFCCCCVPAFAAACCCVPKISVAVIRAGAGIGTGIGVGVGIGVSAAPRAEARRNHLAFCLLLNNFSVFYLTETEEQNAEGRDQISAIPRSAKKQEEQQRRQNSNTQQHTGSEAKPFGFLSSIEQLFRLLSTATEMEEQNAEGLSSIEIFFCLLSNRNGGALSNVFPAVKMLRAQAKEDKTYQATSRNSCVKKGFAIWP